MYRVVHLVAEYCLLTSNYKFHHSMSFLYLSQLLFQCQQKVVLNQVDHPVKCDLMEDGVIVLRRASKTNEPSRESRRRRIWQAAHIRLGNVKLHILHYQAANWPFTSKVATKKFKAWLVFDNIKVYL